jgi:hypothetical protein
LTVHIADSPHSSSPELSPPPAATKETSDAATSAARRKRTRAMMLCANASSNASFRNFQCLRIRPESSIWRNLQCRLTQNLELFPPVNSLAISKVALFCCQLQAPTASLHFQTREEGFRVRSRSGSRRKRRPLRRPSHGRTAVDARTPNPTVHLTGGPSHSGQ